MYSGISKNCLQYIVTIIKAPVSMYKTDFKKYTWPVDTKINEVLG